MQGVVGIWHGRVQIRPGGERAVFQRPLSPPEVAAVAAAPEEDRVVDSHTNQMLRIQIQLAAVEGLHHKQGQTLPVTYYASVSVLVLCVFTIDLSTYNVAPLLLLLYPYLLS